MKCPVERINEGRVKAIVLLIYLRLFSLLVAGHRGDSMRKSSFISPICGYNSNIVDIKITKTQFCK